MPSVTQRHPTWLWRGNKMLWPRPAKYQRSLEGVTMDPPGREERKRGDADALWERPERQGGKAGFGNPGWAPLGL